jgi:DNA-directed RNA polymerase specialized sigma24 family protein
VWHYSWTRSFPQCVGNSAREAYERGRKDFATIGHALGVRTDPNVVDSTAESRYRSLFEAHFAEIWKFARRRCDSSQDADDVTFETFAVAWRRRDDAPAREVRLWLFGVARRILVNHRRSTERQAKVRVYLAETAGHEAPSEGTRESLGAVWGALGDCRRMTATC